MIHLPKFKVPEIVFEKPLEVQNIAQSILRLEAQPYVFCIFSEMSQISALPYANLLLNRMKWDNVFQPASIQTLDVWDTQLPNDIGTRVYFIYVDKDVEAFEFLEVFRAQMPKRMKRVGMLNFTSYAALNVLCVEVFLSHQFQIPKMSAQKQASTDLQEIVFFGVEAFDLSSSIRLVEANAMARHLIMLPTNYLTAGHYLDWIQQLAEVQSWDYELYDKEKLQSLNANGFLAVSRASEKAGIVCLKWSHSSVHFSAKSKKKIALVGKGVCFDTGGVNVKPAAYMYGMHEDMGGSAVALSTFYALTHLNLPIELECWLAICDNMISAHAYLPNEVITMSNGKTVEIVDTDAEGRMILADTLVLASRNKPDYMLDYATLTGSAVRAIGTQMSAVFTNQPSALKNVNLMDAGICSGERVWPFPITEEVKHPLKSDIADIKQCSEKAGPDHIYAAYFLNQFVAHDIDWVHMDLSANLHSGGLGRASTDYIGFGIFWTQAYLSKILK